MSLFTDLISKLDDIFSKYVRNKHADENGFCQCYTCPNKFHWKQVDNGHFIKRGNMSTRFFLDNCRPQCTQCNRFLGGNIKVFEKKLKVELGESKFQDLIDLGHGIRKFTEYELRTLIDFYSTKLKYA